LTILQATLNKAKNDFDVTVVIFANVRFSFPWKNSGVFQHIQRALLEDATSVYSD